MRSRQATAPASSRPSLRKSASFDPIGFSRGISDLVEALDQNGRPLCLLPENEIVNQKLPHKRFAAIALAPCGVFLAAEHPGPIFDITAAGAVKAGRTAEESAASSLSAVLGHCGELKLIKKAPAGLEIFCAHYSEALLKAICPPDFVPLNLNEIAELSRQELISELLLAVLPAINQISRSQLTRACPQPD